MVIFFVSEATLVSSAQRGEEQARSKTRKSNEANTLFKLFTLSIPHFLKGLNSNIAPFYLVALSAFWERYHVKVSE